MKPKFNENSAIRGAIRRMFSRSPVVREVQAKVRREVPKYNKDGSRAKKNAVQYQCNLCKQWTKSTAIAVDHIEPVIDVEHGFTDWNAFVKRLFCEASNLQVVCDDCHQKKTNKERHDRQLLKDKELLGKLEKLSDSSSVIEGLKKFTKKKLLTYPAEIVTRVLALKENHGKAKRGRK